MRLAASSPLLLCLNDEGAKQVGEGLADASTSLGACRHGDFNSSGLERIPQEKVARLFLFFQPYLLVMHFAHLPPCFPHTLPSHSVHVVINKYLMEVEWKGPGKHVDCFQCCTKQLQ